MNDFNIIGGVHETRPVAQVPSISLSRWGIFKAWDKDGKESLHAVGWNGEGRASTDIVEFLPWDGVEGSPIRFKTLSGRLYEVTGTPGINMDAGYVWGRFMAINKLVKEENVSHEYYPRK